MFTQTGSLLQPPMQPTKIKITRPCMVQGERVEPETVVTVPLYQALDIESSRRGEIVAS